MGYFIGADIGTSGTKTILIDEGGNLKASAIVTYPLQTPRPGWAEQKPEDWWKAAKSSVKQLLKQAGIDKSIRL